MNVVELLLIAVGLSMDAFAVSVCKGLAIQKCTWKKAGQIGLWFGVFQGGMPLLGYMLGIQFKNIITSVDHWIAFILLGLIGGNMIREACREEACEVCQTDGCAEEALDAKTMLPLAVATSIDALAVGVTFAFLKVDIVPAVSFIGVVTFLLSAAGTRIGNLCGGRLGKRAEIAGGVILILLGTKILAEHMGFLP